MMNVYLGLGSNLAFPERKLRAAIQAIQKLPSSFLIQCSPFYQSIPWGIRSQPDYYNCVVGIKTRLPPEKLLKACQAIEKKMGRVRKKHWGPRTIDIDILLYGNKTLSTPSLKIPHPYMLDRDFVLMPLLMISPQLKLPNGRLISDYLDNCSKHLK